MGLGNGIHLRGIWVLGQVVVKLDSSGVSLRNISTGHRLQTLPARCFVWRILISDSFTKCDNHDTRILTSNYPDATNRLFAFSLASWMSTPNWNGSWAQTKFWFTSIFPSDAVSFISVCQSSFSAWFMLTIRRSFRRRNFRAVIWSIHLSSYESTNLFMDSHEWLINQQFHSTTLPRRGATC